MMRITILDAQFCIICLNSLSVNLCIVFLSSAIIFNTRICMFRYFGENFLLSLHLYNVMLHLCQIS